MNLRTLLHLVNNPPGSSGKTPELTWTKSGKPLGMTPEMHFKTIFALLRETPVLALRTSPEQFAFVKQVLRERLEELPPGRNDTLKACVFTLNAKIARLEDPSKLFLQRDDLLLLRALIADAHKRCGDSADVADIEVRLVAEDLLAQIGLAEAVGWNQLMAAGRVASGDTGL